MKTTLRTLEKEAVSGAKIWNHDKSLQEKWVPLKRVQDLRTELRELDWRKYGTLTLIKEILGES